MKYKKERNPNKNWNALFEKLALGRLDSTKIKKLGFFLEFNTESYSANHSDLIPNPITYSKKPKVNLHRQNFGRVTKANG